MLHRPQAVPKEAEGGTWGSGLIFKTDSTGTCIFRPPLQATQLHFGRGLGGATGWIVCFFKHENEHQRKEAFNAR